MKNQTSNGTTFAYTAKQQPETGYHITIKWVHGDADAYSETIVFKKTIEQAVNVVSTAEHLYNEELTVKEVEQLPFEAERDMTGSGDTYAGINGVSITFVDDNGKEWIVKHYLD